MAVLAVLIGVVGRLPQMPYNVREVLAPGAAGWASALGLAVVVYTLANVPFVLMAHLRGGRFALFPLLLAGFGLANWAVLRTSVPLESLHDVVGTPVLGWPWEWESIGRFVALHMAVTLPLVGATWFVCVMLRPTALRYFLVWLIVAAALAWPLHEVVVTMAATDNLTELMRDGGSPWSSVLLACGLFFTGVAGSAIAAAVASTRKRLGFVVVGGAAALLAYGAFVLGSEPYIVKYGRVFSALQFLLSTDRDHYVSGGALLLRYVAALSAVSGCLAALQLQALKSWLRTRPRVDMTPWASRANAPLRRRQESETRPAPIDAAGSGAGCRPAVRIPPSA